MVVTFHVVSIQESVIAMWNILALNAMNAHKDTMILILILQY